MLLKNEKILMHTNIQSLTILVDHLLISAWIIYQSICDHAPGSTECVYQRIQACIHNGCSYLCKQFLWWIWLYIIEQFVMPFIPLNDWRQLVCGQIDLGKWNMWVFQTSISALEHAEAWWSASIMRSNCKLVIMQRNQIFETTIK